MTMNPALRSTLAICGLLAPTLGQTAPVTYDIDGTHTFPRFSYSHFGFPPN